MKLLNYVLGILCSFCLMMILLITSIEAVTYWTPGYFEKEYIKYQVDQQIHMEMKDLLYVTEEMMAYLKGNRQDLHVPTKVNGVEREFFNEKEIAHMEDVKGLFLAAIALRKTCVFIGILCILTLYLLKTNMKTFFPRILCIGTGLFLALTALLTAVISTNFTKYFIVFHKIFFKNNLWLLDPNTDLLINIVPEPFFVDTVIRIGLIFSVVTASIFAFCFLSLHHRKNKNF